VWDFDPQHGLIALAIIAGIVVREHRDHKGRPSQRPWAAQSSSESQTSVFEDSKGIKFMSVVIPVLDKIGGNLNMRQAETCTETACYIASTFGNLHRYFFLSYLLGRHWIPKMINSLEPGCA
jgi:hypothetical protein